MEVLLMLSAYDLIIHSLQRDYDVKFINSYKDSLFEVLQDEDFLIIDRRIVELYSLDDLLDSYRKIIVDATESQKSYLSLSPIIEQLIMSGFRRNNRLIAIGGGIIQDITSFLSSIMYRGVEWIFYPTTLLAQGDSCIGGKASINFGEYKNQLGNFHPPKNIFIDVSFIDTLSDLDLRSGIGEMCHFYLVSGQEDYQFFKKEYALALKRDRKALQRLISRCLRIKKGFVEIDEFDKKERLVLNYGHSFGHAIESLTNYEIPHGISVCHGMNIANYISLKFNYFSCELFKELEKLLSDIWGQTKPKNLEKDKFLSALKKDKKNVGSDLRLILTKGIGNMFIEIVPLETQFSYWIGEYFQKYY